MRRSIVVASLAGLGMFLPDASAQSAGGVGSIIVDSDSPVSPPAPSPSFEGRTFIMQYATQNIWELTDLDATGCRVIVGLYVEDSSKVIAPMVPFVGPTEEGLVDWVISSGQYVLAGGGSEFVGMLRAHVSVQSVGGASSQFVVGTTVPAGTEELFQVAMEPTSDVVMQPPASEGMSGGMSEGGQNGGMEMGGIRPSLGSSCSCPACSDGWQMWLPFTVVGFNNRYGEQCCGAACRTACAAHMDGKPMDEVWLIGQGTWVTCMITA